MLAKLDSMSYDRKAHNEIEIRHIAIWLNYLKSKPLLQLL